MKSSGRIWTDEVKYDKVWWKKNVSFPNSYLIYNFKIVEINKEFYIFIDDRYPTLTYNGRTGPFHSFEEARGVLEEDLGNNFPSFKSKANKTTTVLLIMTFWVIYFALDIVMFKFIDGGLNAIGISDDNYFINGFIMLVLNVIAINRIAKLKI